MDSNEYYTLDEIHEFLENISDENAELLMKMANRRWRLSNLRHSRDGSPQDMLHESIVLTLGSDSHKWKRGVELRKHFWGVIRYVGCKWAEKGLKATCGTARLRECEASEEQIAENTNPVFNNIREKDALKYAQQLFFSDDQIAWNVLEAKIRGKGKKDIMIRFGLNDTDYETILKRIRRTLNKKGNGECHEFK